MNPANHNSSTPIRKQSQLTTSPSTSSSPLSLTTDFSSGPSLQDESADQSPRSKVASHFEELRLEGAGVSKLDLKEGRAIWDVAMGGADGARKRKTMTDDDALEIPETPQIRLSEFDDQSLPVQREEHPPVLFKGLSALQDSTPKLAKGYPSINRLSDSESRSRKRMSTPPKSSVGEKVTFERTSIQDPPSSSLTWHDDEITGYKPDDPDDDGEGINGIGFKPTAAQAAARSRRRKQQLSDYKTRESKEARARRNERRRGSAAPVRNTTIAEAERSRRVRFSEGDANSMIKTA